MNNRVRLAKAIMVTSVLAYSLTTPFTKKVLWEAPPHLVVRCFATTLMVLCLVRTLPKLSDFFRGWELFSMVLVSGNSCLFVLSSVTGSANVAICLAYLAFFWAGLIKKFILKESPGRLFIWRSLLLIPGFYLLCGQSLGRVPILSMVSGVVGGIGLGAWLIVRRKREQAAPPTDIIGGFALAAVFFGVVSLFYPAPNLRDFQSATWALAGGALAGFGLWIMARMKKELEDGTILVISTGEIPFAFIFNVLILPVQTAWNEWAGAAFILVAILLEVFEPAQTLQKV